MGPPTVHKATHITNEAAHSWHLRLNHTAPEIIRIMANMPGVPGIPASLKRERPEISSSGCAAGHTQRASHDGKMVHKPPGHTVAASLNRPLQRTNEGFCYAMVVTEPHTRYRIASLLRTKRDAESALLRIIAAVTRHLGQAPSLIQPNNTNELLTKRALTTLGAQGITVTPTTTYTPQENSIAERTFRTILGRVRELIIRAVVPSQRYWGLCMLNTVVKMNATYQRTIANIPLALWEKRWKTCSPFPILGLDFRRFRTLAEHAYVTQLHKMIKSEPRAIQIRYLYCDGKDHLRVMRPDTGQILRCCGRNYRSLNPYMDPLRLIRPITAPREGSKPRINEHHALPMAACT